MIIPFSFLYPVQPNISSNNTSSIVTSGLVFNLQTAPNSGTTWIDATSNGYDATLQGSPTYVSNNGGGIKLNNASYTGNDYISVPYNINSNTVTVEIVASFNPTSHWATVWGNEVYSGGRGYFAFMGSATGINYGRPGLASNEAVTPSNSIRHWTFVINNTAHSLYLNSTQVGTTDTITAQTLFTTNNFYFGSRHSNAGTGHTDKMNNSGSAFQPVFYQMRLYNRALSALEITQNYNAIKTTYGLP
jgi:hypothetical protein